MEQRISVKQLKIFFAYEESFEGSNRHSFYRNPPSIHITEYSTMFTIARHWNLRAAKWNSHPILQRTL
jgi:hypothetical protein